MTDPSPQRVALVTGGAVRVGRAIALGLARAGYDLTLTYRSSAEAAATVRGEVEALGRRCSFVHADLAETDAPERVCAEVREAFGRLDLLVNSAATFAREALLDADAERFDRIMAVNVRAPHLLVRACGDLLRASRGSVVNVVDLSAFQPWLEYPVHAVSKAGLAHLTRVQARALAPEVRVNAVAPGAVLRPEGWSATEWSAVAEAAPLRRAGSPQDVVQAILYLASADFVTGQVLVVDGGRSLGANEAVEG